MNKKFYSFAMMALLAFGGATPLVAQETEELVTEETAAQPEKFQGLQFDVPPLDPKHQAVCDEYMNTMFTEPEKANKSLQRLLRSIQRKPEHLVAVGHYFVTNSTSDISYYGPAKMCSDKVYETPAATQEYVLMFCMETAMLGRDYGNAGRFCDVLLSQNEGNIAALKLKARIYKSQNPIVAIEALEALKKYDPAYYQVNKELGDITKQLRERMSAEEKAEADRKAALEAKDARIAELEKNEKLTTFTNAYMGIGFNQEDARRQAELLFEGDFSSVIANHKAHIDNISKQVVADAITKNHLSTGEPPAKTEDDTALRKAMGLL